MAESIFQTYSLHTALFHDGFYNCTASSPCLMRITLLWISPAKQSWRLAESKSVLACLECFWPEPFPLEKELMADTQVITDPGNTVNPHAEAEQRDWHYRFLWWKTQHPVQA